MVDINREKMKRVLKWIHEKNTEVNQISSRLFNQKVLRVFPLDGSKILLLPVKPIERLTARLTFFRATLKLSECG